MGQFSWKCSLCGEQILNNSKHRNWHQAILVTPTDKHVEEDYEGYGVFGGVDAYAELGARINNEPMAELNSDKYQEQRRIGIDHALSITSHIGIKVVHKGCYNDESYDNLDNAQTDPDQGWLNDEDGW
jgi:hypothetical protein